MKGIADMNIVCNMCGKNIPVENNIPREDFIEINKAWGYFSRKDGKTWKFVVCEECADRLAGQMKIPHEVCDTIELV